ncbi:MAG TPA: alpha amylase C-terminal domain-containing protein, partial [Thermoanaerobaculia bacterium]
DASLDWHLLEDERHAGVARWLEDLARLYNGEPALHELDCSPEGFDWVDGSDADNSVIAFLRRGKAGEPVLVVLHFTPVVRENYRLGVPGRGYWRELLNSDAPRYGGGGVGNYGGVEAVPIPMHGKSHSLTLTLPPLGVLFFKRDVVEDPKDSKEARDVEDELDETAEMEPVAEDTPEDDGFPPNLASIL